MSEELKPCNCGAKNSEDCEMLQIQFVAQSENSSLKREGTIFYIRCLNCGYIGPLVLCPCGLSKKKIFAAWNTRNESDELPGWVKDAIRNEISGLIEHLGESGYAEHTVDALNWVLSLRRGEE